MNIIKHRKTFIGLSVALVVISVFLVAYFGLNLGIDFKGGSLLEVEFTDNRPPNSLLEERLAPLGLESVVLQPTDERGLFIKTNPIDEPTREEILNLISDGNLENIELKTFTTIGPSIGQELKNKALLAIIIVVVAIILYIAYVFRKVSKPVSSWKYGLIAVIALVHDILFTSGVFALFGVFLGAQADSLFIVALLTVLGLSVNDTIVVFDRIRENILINKNEHKHEPFTATVGRSIDQTLVRSINTSLSTILVLVALVIWGPDSIKIFALTLAVGIFIGTYSSIFLASSLLAVWGSKKDGTRDKTL